ncbi:alpha/beta hydrolase family protein [Aquiflexum lacus]|uniref:alpha/beta hydrolase family protein n=1 Tax=Aquiflexum lacus TaxID=2483805 RepID=UPI001894694E|nr:acetylxylan esterase [Aquiflexum lacus]
MKTLSKSFYLLTLLIAIICSPNLFAQEQFNYDESKVPDLVLPDPFVSTNGEIIKSVDDWESIRRPELMRLFAENVYGGIPRDFDEIHFNVSTDSDHLYKEVAMKKNVTIRVTRNGKAQTVNLFVFLPLEEKGPHPVFLLISHRNVQGLLEDKEDRFFPIEQIVRRGYAAAIYDVEDVSPDDKDRFANGILESLYPEELKNSGGMRGLAAWAWGAMRAMDYFESENAIDHKRASLVGHSRGGKAALWAGANDKRWAVVISNESGCGGAALSRRRFGETVKRINTNFPYWFNDNFKTFNDREDALPIDQHLLAACIAPRSIYFASAIEDQWADPKGEFLSFKLGSRVYTDIYGIKVDLPESFENHQRTVHTNSMGYHIREGKHNLTLYDWERFMDFVDKEFK